MSKLAGKVAVVTGASKGIGAAIAKHLAAAGAAVVVNYASDKAGAERVVAEIVAGGGRASAVQGDVSKAVDIARLFGAATASYGTVDILVNNAGVYKFAPIEELAEDEFHRQFNINVLGLLLSIQEALKHFTSGGGSIINIGSVVTSITPPTSVIYTATKAAVASIARVLSKELGSRNIRVNTVAPGGVETEGLHAMGVMGSDFEKGMVAQTPLGRLGQPDDIARIVTFLASDDAGWMTGETLMASGGMR